MKRSQTDYIFAPESEARKHHPLRLRSFLLFLLLVLLALFLANYAISGHVSLKQLQLTILNLPDDLDCYSILHLSDLHGASFGEKQKAIDTALGSTRYSCVVMTGDMLGEDQDVQPLLDLIALMPKDTPKYYICGDMDGSFLDATAHDSLSVYCDWALQLQQAGVTLLDRPISETRGKGTIWFIPEELYTLDLDGMEKVYTQQVQRLRAQSTSLTADDAAQLRVAEYQLQRLSEIRLAKEAVQPQDIQLVLTHTPLQADYVEDMLNNGAKADAFSLRYASLILAGHYNGGQWRLPFMGAIYVPELGYFPDDKLVQGLHYLSGIPQYISPGLGSDPHYGWQKGRVFNAPAFTLITLTNQAN